VKASSGLDRGTVATERGSPGSDPPAQLDGSLPERGGSSIRPHLHVVRGGQPHARRLPDYVYGGTSVGFPARESLSRARVSRLEESRFDHEKWYTVSALGLSGEAYVASVSSQLEHVKTQGARTGPAEPATSALINSGFLVYPDRSRSSESREDGTGAQEGDAIVDWQERYIQRLDEDVRGLQASFDTKFDSLDRQLTAVVREGLEQARHLDEARQRELLDLGSEIRGAKIAIIGLFVATLLSVGGMVLAVLLAIMKVAPVAR